jgi:hypothetical protein
MTQSFLARIEIASRSVIIREISYTQPILWFFVLLIGAQSSNLNIPFLTITLRKSLFITLMAKSLLLAYVSAHELPASLNEAEL